MDRIKMDIIIPSNAATRQHELLTMQALRTCEESSKAVDFRYIILEQQRHTKYEGRNIKTLHYNFEFNYNRCLNYGFEYSTSPYVAFCNNDLYFTQYWAEMAVHAIEQGYPSVSPSRCFLDYSLYVGYQIGKQLLGWCIVTKRDVIERIGGLDTSVKFWYSDNLYAEQLKAAGIKHALVGYSVVHHLVSRSRNVMRPGTRSQMERGQHSKFVEAKKRIWSKVK